MRESQRQKGLTMMELLVAMAVLSVLFMAIYNLFSSGLKNSSESSARADLDAQTQKVQQLIVARVKEANRFLAKSAVTISDSQGNSSSPYLPASTLTASQILIFEVPTKNNTLLCEMYAYYPVPAKNLLSTNLTLQRRLLNASSSSTALALIQGKTATPYTCSGTLPAITELSVLHPSLDSTNGFVSSAYMVGSDQQGVTLTLKGYQLVGTKGISTLSYQTRVLTRNLNVLNP